MDPQAFLANRIDTIKRLFTGQGTPNEYIDQAKLAVPGIVGKAGVHSAHQLAKSAGSPGQSTMSGLGIRGDAPVYATPLNDIYYDKELGNYGPGLL